MAGSPPGTPRGATPRGYNDAATLARAGSRLAQPTAARDFTELSLTYGPTLRAAVGSVLYLGLIAVLSTGIAAMVRDSAVSIGLALGLLYLFPVVDAFIGNQVWHNRIARYSPMAGLNIQATTGPHSLPISPWGGLGVLAIWSAGALLTGGLVLRARDA